MKVFIITLVLLTVPLLAHTPKSVDLEYDSETGILNVAITHSVNNASKHYVYKVIVELNGKEIIEQKFKRQTDDELQEVVYKVIDAKEGDKIAVTAYCNISGKKKASLEIMAQEGDGGSE
jgi:desulfoferrodoxin (superoxide reductase-like protein)